MLASRRILLVLALAAGCTPDGGGEGRGTSSGSTSGTAAVSADSAAADSAATTQGREYTRWFYDREFDKLWDRFSPEMRGTFASSAELAALAGRTVEGFGKEQGQAVESVTREDSVRVYTRTSRFERSPDSVTVQWTVKTDGTVTGFVIRPTPPDSTP